MNAAGANAAAVASVEPLATDKSNSGVQTVRAQVRKKPFHELIIEATSHGQEAAKKGLQKLWMLTSAM